MEQVIQLLQELADSHFFGALTLKFESGRVIYLKKEETLKPTYRDNRRKTNDEDSIY